MTAAKKPSSTTKPKRKSKLLIAIIVIGIVIILFVGLAMLALQALNSLADRASNLSLCSTTQQVAYQVDQALPGNFSTIRTQETCSGQPDKLVTSDRLVLMVASESEFNSKDEALQAISESLEQDGWSLKDDRYTNSQAPNYEVSLSTHSHQPALVMIALENTQPSSDISFEGERLKIAEQSDEVLSDYLMFTAYQPTFTPDRDGAKWGRATTSKDLDEWRYSLHRDVKRPMTIVLRSLPASSRQAQQINADDSGFGEIWQLNDGTPVIGRFSAQSGLVASQEIYVQKGDTYIGLQGVNANQDPSEAYQQHLTKSEAIKIFESLEAINKPAK